MLIYHSHTDFGYHEVLHIKCNWSSLSVLGARYYSVLTLFSQNIIWFNFVFVPKNHSQRFLYLSFILGILLSCLVVLGPTKQYVSSVYTALEGMKPAVQSMLTKVVWMDKSHIKFNIIFGVVGIQMKCVLMLQKFLLHLQDVLQNELDQSQHRWDCGGICAKVF